MTTLTHTRAELKLRLLELSREIERIESELVRMNWKDSRQHILHANLQILYSDYDHIRALVS
jgi:hypothetical protein